MYRVVAGTAALLPDDRVRYLMGTGMPDDLVECVAAGIDLFDCVLPTRNARNGQLLTREGPLSIKWAEFARRCAPARSRVPVLHLPAVLPRLPALSARGRRDDRKDPQHTA